MRATWEDYFDRVTVGGFTVRVWHTAGELRWEDEVKPCSVLGCKTPTHWRRPWARGAATHPSCESSLLDRTTPQLYAQSLAAVLGALPVAGIEELDVGAAPAESIQERPARRIGSPTAWCERCGGRFPGYWVAARTWRCAEHPPADENYRRRR